MKAINETMTHVREKPLLVTLENARAIDLGKKTLTRRLSGLKKVNFDPHNWIYKGQNFEGEHIFWPSWTDKPFATDCIHLVCPFGNQGDHLWVREPWKTLKCWDDTKPSELPDGAPMEYLAGGMNVAGLKGLVNPGKYRHARFMCRRMSRTLLEIVKIRAERLQDISREDCMKEGVPYTEMPMVDNVRDKFKNNIWNSINGPNSWDQNPWIWRIEFRRIKNDD